MEGDSEWEREKGEKPLLKSPPSSRADSCSADLPHFQLVDCCVYSIQRHSYLASSGSFSAHHLFLLLRVNIRSAMSGAIRSGSVRGATSLMTGVLWSAVTVVTTGTTGECPRVPQTAQHRSCLSRDPSQLVSLDQFSYSPEDSQMEPARWNNCQVNVLLQSLECEYFASLMNNPFPTEISKHIGMRAAALDCCAWEQTQRWLVCFWSLSCSHLKMFSQNVFSLISFWKYPFGHDVCYLYTNDRARYDGVLVVSVLNAETKQRPLITWWVWGQPGLPEILSHPLPLFPN